MIRVNAFLAAGLTAALLAGCQMPTFGSARQQPRPPAPLLAAPVGAVQQGQLPPPGGQQVAGVLPEGGVGATAAAEAALAGGAGGQPGGTQVAAADATGAVEVGRTDLLGGWTLSSGSENCELFMTLTSWSGGYRATTRNCTSPALQGVSAWNLDGREVALVDQSGATVARLVPSTKTRFSGQTSTGTPVSVFR